MNDTLRQRVDAFVEELSELIRAQALDAVQGALGASTGAGARRSGARKKAARKKAGRPAGRKKAARSTGAAGGGGRSAGALLDVIRRKPGQRLEEIARAMGTTTDNLRPALNELLGDGRVHTEGQARGTRYLAGAGAGRKKAGARKKKAARKKAGRKAARKKTGRKKAGARKKKKKATRRTTTAGATA